MSKEWAVTAGPRQAKVANAAIKEILRQHKYHRERYGVIGVDEHSSQFYSMFGTGHREDVEKAYEEIGAMFDWMITPMNHKTIVSECAKRLQKLIEDMPCEDNRVTVEQDEERKAKIATMDAEREAKSAEKQRAVAARAEKLRELYPWAAAEDGKITQHARCGKNIRYELGLKFPNVRFKVTSEYYSVSIHWDLGPTSEEVNDIVGKYQNGHFDGMTDCQENDHSVDGEAIGVVLGRVRHVSTSRDIESHIREAVMAKLCQLAGVPFNGPYTTGVRGPDDVETVERHTHELLHKTSFPGGTTLKDVVLDPWKEGDPDDHHWCKILFTEPLPVVIEHWLDCVGNSVSYSQKHDGIEIRFQSKPDPHVLLALTTSQNGYRFYYNRAKVLWYTRYSPHAWKRAHEIAGIELQPDPKAQPQQQPDRFDRDVEDRMAEQCGL